MAKIDIIKKRNEIAMKLKRETGYRPYVTKRSFIKGFDAAIELMLEREKKLREALVNAEKELFRFNCEAPLTLTAIEKPEYLSIREVLIAVPELK